MSALTVIKIILGVLLTLLITLGVAWVYMGEKYERKYRK